MSRDDLVIALNKLDYDEVEIALRHSSVALVLENNNIDFLDVKKHIDYLFKLALNKKNLNTFQILTSFARFLGYSMPEDVHAGMFTGGYSSFLKAWFMSAVSDHNKYTMSPEITKIIKIGDFDTFKVLLDNYELCEFQITHYREAADHDEELMFKGLLSKITNYSKKASILIDTPLPSKYFKLLFDIMLSPERDDNALALEVVKKYKLSPDLNSIKQILSSNKKVLQVAMENKQTELIPDTLKKIFLIKDKK